VTIAPLLPPSVLGWAIESAPSIDATSIGVVSIVVWAAALIQLAAISYWAYEMFLPARRQRYSPPVHDLGEVQARVLTVDGGGVVQATVDALPPEIEECHVISEEPIAVAGATVHVVPDAFECAATRKGRALEWARREIPCEREYVLFLDEDTITTDLDGIPDGDVVQFRERPTRSRSLLAYLAEIYRMGFQTEQLAFSRLAIPLYAWGGGLAVRKELEDRITWDRETLIEDTSFVWNAMRREAVDFEVSETKFDTQAPPSIRAMIDQRSRWLAGSQDQSGLLSSAYRAICTLRNVAWAMSALVPVLVLVPFLIPGTGTFGPAFRALSLVLFGPTVLWSVLGVTYYDESLRVGVLLVLLAPLVSVLHSAGAFVGFTHPPQDFDVTTKVKPDLINGLGSDTNTSTDTDTDAEAEIEAD
jgi:hypothetical protein